MRYFKSCIVVLFLLISIIATISPNSYELSMNDVAIRTTRIGNIERIEYLDVHILLIPIISLLIEIIQYTTGLGLFELDDLFGNSFGGIVGVFFAQSCEDVVFHKQGAKSLMMFSNSSIGD